PAPTTIYTLSLHDALPIYAARNFDQSVGSRQPDRAAIADSFAICVEIAGIVDRATAGGACGEFIAGPVTVSPQWTGGRAAGIHGDRKSTRLNSSHVAISYA